MTTTAEVAHQLHRSRANMESAVSTLGAAFQALRADEIPVSAATVHAVAATEDRWAAIDREFGLLTSAQVAALQGSTNRQLAYDQRRAGRILGARRGAKRVVYPAFQFDQEGQPRQIIAQLARMGSAAGWTDADVLLWLIASTSYLPDDARPVDVLASNPGQVAAAAQAKFTEQW